MSTDPLQVFVEDGATLDALSRIREDSTDFDREFVGRLCQASLAYTVSKPNGERHAHLKEKGQTLLERMGR